MKSLEICFATHHQYWGLIKRFNVFPFPVSCLKFFGIYHLFINPGQKHMLAEINLWRSRSIFTSKWKLVNFAIMSVQKPAKPCKSFSILFKGFHQHWPPQSAIVKRHSAVNDPLQIDRDYHVFKDCTVHMSYYNGIIFWR